MKKLFFLIVAFVTVITSNDIFCASAKEMNEANHKNKSDQEYFIIRFEADNKQEEELFNNKLLNRTAAIIWLCSLNYSENADHFVERPFLANKDFQVPCKITDGRDVKYVDLYFGRPLLRITFSVNAGFKYIVRLKKLQFIASGNADYNLKSLGVEYAKCGGKESPYLSVDVEQIQLPELPEFAQAEVILNSEPELKGDEAKTNKIVSKTKE